MNIWEELEVPLSLPVLRTINTLKYESMTPVQASSIPQFMKHKDVAVEAVTGSGKTLAFVIPMIEILLKLESHLKKHDIAAVIISPTRELARQIYCVVKTFLEEIPEFSIKLLTGGTSPLIDEKEFQGNGGHILVGTPGRMEDFLQRKFDDIHVSACVKSLEVLILDEADRLLNMGFKKSLTTILGLLPKQRRTGIFSATLNQDVEDLIRAGMRNPVRISIKQKSLSNENSDQKTPVLLRNYYMICSTDMKLNNLVEFLKEHKKEKIIVFFNTCACVDYFSKVLQGLLPKTKFLAIHRKRDKRNEVFARFHELESGVLMCTDVMGRGIDVPNISWVVQFDPPVLASDFVHRCGRTARIGNVGNALVMLSENEEPYVEFVRLNQKVPLELYTMGQTSNFMDRVKAMSIADRAIYEKGLQAYVSFIQSYSKHECSLIFRIKELNLGKLAQCFGLLHLPKMPELKNCEHDFVPTPHDYFSIPFRDKHREKLRQAKLSKGLIGRASEKLKEKSSSATKHQTWTKKKRRNSNNIDVDELFRDARSIKKFKSGKMSKEEFEESFRYS